MPVRAHLRISLDAIITSFFASASATLMPLIPVEAIKAVLKKQGISAMVSSNGSLTSARGTMF